MVFVRFADDAGQTEFDCSAQVEFANAARRMFMKNYIAKRLLQLIPILLGITLLSFFLMWISGGDAVTSLIENQEVAVSQDIIDARKHELGLDQPFLVQYVSWLGNFLTGNLGQSYVSGNDVLSTFLQKLPATVVLALSAMILTLIISIPLGVLCAVKHNKAVDYIVRFLGFISNSMPNFFVALLLILLFSIKLGWLPVMSSTIGKSGLDSITLQGAVLPTLTLAIAMSAKYTRQIRATVLDELSKPYVQGARARGISERTILFKNVIRGCMPVIVTLIALSIGDLLGGTAIVETIFEWDGVGKLAIDSISMHDSPMIQAYVVWMAIIYVVINLVADIVHQKLDPRLTLCEAKA